MKTMKTYTQDKNSPTVMLMYDNNLPMSDLAEYLYLFLETACEADGFKLRFDLHELCEEIEP